VWLRVAVTETARDSARCDFSFSTDAITFTPVGTPFMAREGKWVGAKVGLFAISPDSTRRNAEYVDVDWFHVR
jgi:hypothetical protein